MSPSRKAGTPLQMLLLAAMILAPLSFLISIPWLKQQPDGTVFLLAAIAATVTIAASFALAVLHERRLDEWQRSNARFSSQWGWTVGSALVALLLAVPPFRDWIVAAAADVANVANPDQKLVILAFTFGFGIVVVTQSLCTMLLSMGWTYWKSRPSRDPS